MFKILKTLSKSLGGSKPAAAPAPAPAAKPGSLLDKVNKSAPPAATTTASAPPKTAEELCGVTAKMSKDEIRAHLKLLFRRYNRTASSLDAKLRHEAETMLDAIVQVREKHFGEI